MMKKMTVLAVMAVMMLAVLVSQQTGALGSPVVGCSTAFKFNTCRLPSRSAKVSSYAFKTSNGDKQSA